MNNNLSELMDEIKKTSEIYQQYVEAIGEKVQEQNRLFAPMIRELVRTSEIFSKEHRDIFASINENIRSVFAGIDFETITKSFQLSLPDIDIQERYQKKEKRFIEIMAEAGWPLLLDAPISFTGEALKEYDQLSKDQFGIELEKSILEFYSNEIMDKVFNRWVEYDFLRSRIEILEKVIEAHKKRNYIVSIPTLLPQIEGTLTDYYKSKNDDEKRRIEIFIDYLFKDDDHYIPIKGLIIDRLYENYYWGDEKLPVFSRHAVLHGADTGYGTEINSLRAILVYDMIAFIISLKENYKK